MGGVWDADPAAAAGGAIAPECRRSRRIAESYGPTWCARPRIWTATRGADAAAAECAADALAAPAAAPPLRSLRRKGTLLCAAPRICRTRWPASAGGGEAAELRHQGAVDRLGFVEPTYATARASCGGLYDQHADLSGRHGEAEDERAALVRSIDAVKRHAALAVSPESENAGLKECAAGRDREIGRLPAGLRKHAKGRVVCTSGPNTPPPEARAHGDPECGGGAAGGGALPAPQPAPLLPGAGCDAMPSSNATSWMLPAAVESAAGLRVDGGGGDVADSAVAIALDSIGAAFLNATVGTETGARAEEAGQDGTPNGGTWLWVFHNYLKTAYRTGTTRSSMMIEKYVGNFDGVWGADRYAAYPKALPGCEIQSCWAHELRNAEADALLPDATPEAGELAGEIRGALAMAKDMIAADGGRHSRSLRIAMESELRDILDRHAGSEDPIVRRMVERTRRALPSLFVFVEYEGVDPTNNRSEHPIRPRVMSRKTSQQYKGGRRSMERADHMSTCTRTWRDEGKSVFREVRRTILEHGTPWMRRWGPRPPPTGPGPPAAHAGPGEEAVPDRRRWAGPAFPALARPA